MFPITIIRSKAGAAGLRLLLIGGHAVNHYAEPRATLDVDLLVRSSDGKGWRDLLKEEGFTLRHDGGNFLQFEPPYGTPWRLDLMLVNSTTFEKLEKRARTVTCFEAPMLIPSPEHLIALKLHAMANGPVERFEKDFIDVVGIARNQGWSSESPLLKEIVGQFGTTEIYEKLKARLG